MAKNIIPETAWTKARTRFIEDLDESEKAGFLDATFENIFYNASAAQKIHQTESFSKKLADKTNVLLSGINAWGKALDAYANASATILCPLWGSIRVVIHLSSEFGKYFDCLLNMLADIGDVVPRFQIYERLFQDHLRLTQALSNAYLDVIEFCTTVKNVFKKAQRKHVVNFRILLKVAWKSVDKEFGSSMKRFREHRKVVEKEAGLASMLEEGKARDVECRILAQLETQKKEEERIRTLSLLSSVQWQKQQWQASRLRYQDTGSWILEVDAFRTWREMTFSSCLWCSGMPGCGKTVLTAGIVETLTTDTNDQYSALAYFYCDYADSNTLDLISIIGTLIQQLLIKKPTMESSVASSIHDIYDQGLRHPQTDRLIELLCTVLDEYTVVYIIIDGIDETSSDTQEGICDLVKRLVNLQDTSAKILISSRESSQLSEAFEPYLHFQMSADETTKDINAYIKGSITEKLAGRSVVQKNPGLLEAVEHELTMKAEGMFLWVYFQIEELSDPTHSEHSFQATLRDLPRGLTETFQRIYDKVHRKSMRQIALATRIFRWALGARRHLTLTELQEAVSIEPGDKYLERDKVSTESDGKRFLDVCGALIFFDQSGNTVRLAHHTVAQFLKQHLLQNAETRYLLADTCMTYLNFADFDSQISKAEKKGPIIKWNSPAQSPFYRIIQFLGVSRGVLDFLLNLYNRGDRKTLPDVDYVELLKKFQKESPVAPLDTSHQLLTYVRQYWIWHTTNFEQHDHGRISELRALIFRKNLLFNFCPWDAVQDPKHLPHLTMFLWAVGAPHIPLLRLLGEITPLQKFFKCIPEPQIQQLIAEGELDVLRLLLREDPKIAANHTYMRRALLSEQVDVLQLLFKVTASLDTEQSDGVAEFLEGRHDDMGDPLGYKKAPSTESLGLQPLHIAAYEGNVQLLWLFTSLGASVNGTDSAFRTPLFYACCSPCASSRVSTVQMLLKQGATVDAKDCYGETALQHILKSGSGRVGVVRELIANGAGLHHVNKEGSGVYETALKHASAETVKLLRKHGLDIESTNSTTGFTLLLQALSSGKMMEEEAMSLIAGGADPNARGQDEMSALHHAINAGLSSAVVKSLLDSGARVNAKDRAGRSPLDLAVSCGSLAIVNILIKYGADLKSVDSKWEPALIHPIRHGRADIVKALLASGADANVKDHGDPPKSALACAVMAGKIEIAKLLIHCGAEVRPSPPSFVHNQPSYWAVPHNQFDDPFYWAVVKGSVSILRLLFEHLQKSEKPAMKYLWDFVDLQFMPNAWNDSNHRKAEIMRNELRELGVQEHPTNH